MKMRRSIALFGVIFGFYLPTQLVNSATVTLPKTGQEMCWDDLNSPIACSSTGQDGEIEAGVAWPTPRLVDNGDGTISDKLTGLTWLKDANCMATRYSTLDTDETAGDGAVNWQHALAFIAGINSGINPACGVGKTDWRLPNVNELESLANAFIGNGIPKQTTKSWLTAGGFLNVQTKLYWSSTTSAAFSDTAFDVDLEFGWVAFDGKTYGHHILPVRGGQTGPPDVGFPANLWKTGQTIQYTGGDDGDLERGVSWPGVRFTDNNDGTVSDNLTGLVWLKDANCMATQYPGFDKDSSNSSPGQGTVTFAHALDFVAGMNSGAYPNCAGGKADWRLPNRKEIYSLIDFSHQNPALPMGHPFLNVGLLYYWTSTSFWDTREAWYQDMGHGRLLADFKSSENRVWAVRGGPGGATLLATPMSKDVISHGATVFSVDSSDPFSARPLGFGSVAVSGDTLSLQVGIIGFTGPVDLYIAVEASSLFGNELQQIKPDLTFQPLSGGLIPWKSSTNGPIHVNLYGDISVSLLPNGLYTFYFAATPAGSWASYYVWTSSLTIP